MNEACIIAMVPVFSVCNGLGKGWGVGGGMGGGNQCGSGLAKVNLVVFMLLLVVCKQLCSQWVHCIKM